MEVYRVDTVVQSLRRVWVSCRVDPVVQSLRRVWVSYQACRVDPVSISSLPKNLITLELFVYI